MSLLKQARSKKGDSRILVTLDFLLILCQLHASVPPAFPSASNGLSPVSFFACKTPIPFFSIQGVPLSIPRLWWEEFF